MGERRPDGGRPHRCLRARPGPLLVLLPPALPIARRQAPERAPTRRSRSSSAAGARGRDHAEHRPPASRRRLGERGRGARLDRDLVLHPLRDLVRDREVDALFDEEGVARCRPARGAGQTRRRPLRRAAAAERDGDGPAARRTGRSDALRRLLARRPPGRRRCHASRWNAAAAWRSSPRGRRPTTTPPSSSSTARSTPSWAPLVGGARLAAEPAQNLTPAVGAGVEDRFGARALEARGALAERRRFRAAADDRFAADPAGDGDFDAAALAAAVRLEQRPVVVAGDEEQGEDRDRGDERSRRSGPCARAWSACAGAC